MHPVVLRVARPVRSLLKSVAFYEATFGFEETFRSAPTTQGERFLVGLRLKDCDWHLELVEVSEEEMNPPRSQEEMLVLYVGEDFNPAIGELALQNGGTRAVPSNPYWLTDTVIVRDPDGYMIAVTGRSV
jgi:catechol 2,3-dioxygenase-like lactoylglutathione lyase family enzyme